MSVFCWLCGKKIKDGDDWIVHNGNSLHLTCFKSYYRGEIEWKAGKQK